MKRLRLILTAVSLCTSLIAYKRKLTATTSSINHYDGFYAYVLPLCFEFRVCKLIGVAASCGEISWDNYAIPESGGRESAFNFLLNKGVVSVRFYLK